MMVVIDSKYEFSDELCQTEPVELELPTEQEGTIPRGIRTETDCTRDRRMVKMPACL